MTVVDASAVVELLLGSERGRAVGAALAGSAGPLAAPDLLDVEVVHAFRRLLRAGVVDDPRASASVDLLHALPVTRHSSRPLVHRIWAHRRNLSAYDGAYVALAEALGADLLTCDRRLAAAPGHHASVRLI